MAREVESSIFGCLLGAAVGDAFGAAADDHVPVKHVAETRGSLGPVTSLTQQALFTAEGLIRARVRALDRGICAPDSVIEHALLRWSWTQGVSPRAEVCTGPHPWPDGWLVRESILQVRRRPSAPWLDALGSIVKLGDLRDLRDDDGDAMVRVAPVGLMLQPRDAFSFGIACAMKHEVPAAAYLAASVAELIASLLAGASVGESLSEVKRRLRSMQDGIQTLHALRGSEAGRYDAPSGPVDAALVLAAVVSAIAARPSFERGMHAAARASAAPAAPCALVGGILGLLDGAASIPRAWRSSLDVRGIVKKVAHDITRARREDFRPTAATREDYPGW